MRKGFFERDFLGRFVRVIITVYVLLFLFRLIEALWVFIEYGFSKNILVSELLGFGLDVLGVSFFLPGYFIIHFLLRKKPKMVRAVNISLLALALIFVVPITAYFLYQLIPLDIFFYNYSFRELTFTLNSHEGNRLLALFGVLLFVLLVACIARFLNRVNVKRRVVKVSYLFMLLSIPLFFVVNPWLRKRADDFMLNKSHYFLTRSLNYFFTHQQDNFGEITEFQEFFPRRQFVDKEYPLLHEREKDSQHTKYFNSFSNAPNIVILIVEGLSDDFLYDFRGASLMPFLQELKDKSLYWKRCFTLGERSFAAVPSILGGLPHGDRGFTLQERLPRHLSLVSVLNRNGYYTTFYYGQGAWFHQKDRFFKYNQINLIFDKERFSPQRPKIIVGDNRFFWGYNDADLFSQSLEVIDTLNKSPRLDIYFTGSTHFPFVVNNDEHYSHWIEQQEDAEFFSNYATYLKSIRFADDALRDFFYEYSQGEEYKNTIFVITGDHPMTEIPIKNSLKRYHVPLLIFSEKLKGPKVFEHTVSHNDIWETLLNLLDSHLEIVPNQSTSLGGQLFPNPSDLHFPVAFMNDNREVVDFLWGDYFLTHNALYRVDSLLNISPMACDSIYKVMVRGLNAFNRTNFYTVGENRMMSASTYCQQLGLRNYFYKRDTIPERFDSEFYEVIPNQSIPNEDFFLDFSFIAKGRVKDLTLVYQLTNSSDSILFWENVGVNGHGKVTQSRIAIKKAESSDTMLFFKAYFWNQKRTNIKIYDTDILLHSAY